MKKGLKIIAEKSPLGIDKTAAEVYNVLSQKDSLCAELAFVTEDEIRALNRDFRNTDRVTDVLSFPSLDGIRGKTVSKKDFPLDCTENGLFIGSVAICPKRAAEQAQEYGHSYEREVLYLFCHGLLHLFGYDHITEADKREMRAYEEEVMNNIRCFR